LVGAGDGGLGNVNAGGLAEACACIEGGHGLSSRTRSGGAARHRTHGMQHMAKIVNWRRKELKEGSGLAKKMCTWFLLAGFTVPFYHRNKWILGKPLFYATDERKKDTRC
jgi:hypothetical protein